MRETMKKFFKNPQTIFKAKQFINNYNWKKVNLPTEPKGWEKFKSNNN